MTRPVTRSHLQAVLACVLLAGCSDEDPPVVIEITVGHETTAFHDLPAVLTLDIEALDPTDALLATATTTPGGSFSLGEFPPDQMVHIRAHGKDAGGVERMTGKSLVALAGGIQSEVWPVFVQRVGAFARPPGELLHGHIDGLGGVIGERFLFLTGGTGIEASEPADAGTFAYYDMLALGGSAGGRIENIAPRSLVVSAEGSAVLLIDDERAVWFDLNTGIIPIDVPAGLDSFADVAGGMTVRGPEASYVVGATRLDAASNRVLIVHPDRSLAVVQLMQPRTGAAATWIEEQGLVVAGGGDTDYGVEVLVGDNFTPRDFEADLVVGAGATAGIVEGHVVLLCGRNEADPAPARSLDLRCSSACAPQLLPELDFGATLERCNVYNTGEGKLVAVGTDVASGAIRVFEIAPSLDGVTEILLREPRRGAVAVPAPNGTLCLLGGEKLDGSGGAFTVESLMP